MRSSVAPLPEQTISNSAADRAGAILRRFYTHDDVAPEEAIRAYQTVSEYRAMHEVPLRRVTSGVRGFVWRVTQDEGIRPAQRFKRMDRIVDKLFRYPEMRLSQMEDIGGCRVVLRNLDQVYGVANRIRHRWPHVKVLDYIDQPKESGYRALHLIERRERRLVEIQLRTPRQHAWADAVETWVPPAVPFNLKDAGGPEDVKEYFRVAAELFALEDRGEMVDDRLVRELGRLQTLIERYTRRT